METAKELNEDVKLLGKAFDIFYNKYLSGWIEREIDTPNIVEFKKIKQGEKDYTVWGTVDFHNYNDLLNYFTREGLHNIETGSVISNLDIYEYPIEIICSHFIDNMAMAEDMAYFIFMDVNTELNESK